MSDARFTTKIVGTVTALDKADWDSVFPSIAEGYNFFQTIDQTLRQQFKTFYIAIYEQERPVCIAPCFIAEYPLETTIEGPLKNFILKIRKIFPHLFNLHVLVCGSPACEGRIGIKSDDREAVTECLIDAMRGQAKKERIGIVAFKDFAREFSVIFPVLRRRGFHEIESYPAVELPIRFKSFEDYLSSLSRATRKDLKRKFARVKGHAAITLEVTNSLGEDLDYAYELYLSTLNKSEVRFEILSKEFFRDISRYMPQETRYFLWKINGRLVAFNLCLVADGVLVDEYLGMDYTFAYDYHLYYVTFRDILTWSIANGITRYESGALSYDPKKRLDFTFVEQFIYVQHTKRFFNFLLGFLCAALKPDNYDPLLKAIKKPAKNGTKQLTTKVFALIVMTDLLEAAAEVFFKKGALATGITDITPHSFIPFVIKIFSTPVLWGGIGIYIMNFFLWMAVLARVDLSVAFPVGSTTYILTPILAMIFLHEKVGLMRWGGIIMVTIGIYLVSQTPETREENNEP